MSALNPATEIPASIDTLEKLVLYALLTLHNIYNAQTYQELQGSLLERVIDTSMITAADGTIRMISRVSIELDPAYVTAVNQKLWTFAREFGTAAVPAAYKVD